MQEAPTRAAERVSLIPVLNDNYVFVLLGDGPGPAAVVDPAVAEPVAAPAAVEVFVFDDNIEDESDHVAAK